MTMQLTDFDKHLLFALLNNLVDAIDSQLFQYTRRAILKCVELLLAAVI